MANITFFTKRLAYVTTSTYASSHVNQLPIDK